MPAILAFIIPIDPGLGIGGGPIIPPGQPPVISGPPGPWPTPPIYYPPEVWPPLPPSGGLPPGFWPGDPPPRPHPTPPPGGGNGGGGQAPPGFGWVWIPGQGWTIGWSPGSGFDKPQPIPPEQPPSVDNTLPPVPPDPTPVG